MALCALQPEQSKQHPVLVSRYLRIQTIHYFLFILELIPILLSSLSLIMTWGQ